MAQIAGKYELVENKNFYEMLLKFGYPEENAKKVNETKSTLEAEVDGNKIRFTYDSNFNKHVTEFVLNQEVDEKLASGTELKSTAAQNGSVLTIDSKLTDGTPGGQRVLTFSDAGFEMKIIPSHDDVPTATRIYKRV